MYLYPPPKLLQVPLGLIGGVGGAMLLFYFLNMLVESLPGDWSRRMMPYAFLLPAFGLIGLLLIYPAVQTILYSFANSDSTAFVGMQNFTDVLSDPEMQSTLVNNLLWLAIVPALTVALGLAVAQLADKLSPQWEKIAKSVIFLPMAISFVGAATIWRFIYAYAPEGRPQIGLLNAIITKLGFEPVAWLNTASWNFNDLLLMVILVWLQTGFAMVLISSAIKAVPEETLEAARIDGASEWQIFWQVVVPQIRGTLITVFITVLILVLKVFDVVYVMTNGQYDTNVIGLRFFQEIFINGENGIASAIVVLLMLAVLPVLVYQVRHFRAEERAR
jgi:alpha-glucoside transport system permease protein